MRSTVLRRIRNGNGLCNRSRKLGPLILRRQSSVGQWPECGSSSDQLVIRVSLAHIGILMPITINAEVAKTAEKIFSLHSSRSLRSTWTDRKSEGGY